MVALLRSLALAALLMLPVHPVLAWDKPAPAAAAENTAPADRAMDAGAISYRDANPVIQDYQPDPAIWQLADEDTRLYFFGTVHALPEGFRWRSALLEDVIAKSDEIVFESRSDDSAGEDGYSALLETLSAGQDNAPPISERLSEQNRPKWRRLAELTGLDFPLFDAMPPSMTLLYLGVATSTLRGSDGQYGVESVLESEFKAAGKPISAIEDPAAVLRTVIGIDDALAIAQLEIALSSWDGESLAGFEQDMSGYDWRLEHLWALGIEDERAMDDWLADPFSSALYKILLVDRNRQWARWIIDRMNRPGTVLIAVGGAHFEGPDSVQAMLGAKGYDVRRLNPPGTTMPSQLLEYSEN